MRTRAWRRAQRERKIGNRLRLVSAISGTATYYLETPGRLDKLKPFDCSCWMCQYPHRPPDPPFDWRTDDPA